MSFGLFMRILKMRSGWIAGAVLLVALGAAVVGSVRPDQYSAETDVLVSFQGAGTGADGSVPASLFSEDVATQINLITSHVVALKAVDALGLMKNADLSARFERAIVGASGGPGQWWGAIRDWFTREAPGAGLSAEQARQVWADRLRHRLAVKNDNSSGVITLSFSSADPWVSKEAVNAFAQSYMDTSVSLNVEPAREDAQWFDAQLKTLAANLQQAQAKLSDYQQQNGIVAADERVDTENARLQELSSQVTAAQAKTLDLKSKQEQVQAFLASDGSSGLIPDVLDNPMVVHLQQAISDQQTQIDSLAGKVGKNHPAYRDAVSQLKSLHKRLADEIATVSDSLNANLSATVQHERTLTEALAEQKRKVLSLRQGRDQLSFLKTDVDNAQHAYDAALQRMSQARLQSHSTRTNVSVINKAIEPVRPSNPGLALYLAVGIVLGLIIGVGIALYREIQDRRVRGTDDIREFLDIPVLANVVLVPAHNRPVRRRPRLLPSRRLLSGTIGKAQ